MKSAEQLRNIVRQPVRYAAFAAILALAGCTQPNRDPAKLRTIRSEAQILMAKRQARAFADVPTGQLPSGIANLHPNVVTVYSSGVEIEMKPYFDGGWGYFVPRGAGKLPEPAGRYSALGEGVYWYHPY